jgi:hypothetical protein
MVLRSVLISLALLGGCVESAEDPTPASHIEIHPVTATFEEEQVDLCELASELTADNVCSLICDPQAMADFLVAGGMAGGKCVQLRCQLPGIQPIQVGVCLPP